MNRLPKLLILAGLLAPATTAYGTATADHPILPASRISFDGTSTVRSFTCKAGKVDGTVDAAPGQSPALVLKGQKAVQDVTLTIPVAALACGNGTMDGHMKKALKADASPNIRFKLGSYDLSGTTAKLNGTLSIAGQERPITLSGSLSEDANGQVRFKGSKQIRMTEWGVKPPTLMMGTMKVGDAVTVNFDMVVGA